MKRCLLTLIVALVLAQHSPAADGIAVSVAYRTGSNNNYVNSHRPSFVPECNPAEPGWGWGYYYLRGQIVKYIVTNNIPSAGDTIYPGLRDGLAQHPSLSFDGTKVAFFRWGCSVGKSPTSGADTLLGQSNPAHISIINIDGTGLNDLVTLPAPPAFESALEWTADGWIYYTRPRPTYSWYWQRESREIWRVNARDPSVNQAVATYATSDPADTFFHCETWTVSKSGAFSLFTRSDTALSIAHLFPPASGDYRARGVVTLSGDHGAISAGGNCIALYQDATNTRASVYMWDHFTGTLNPSKPVAVFGPGETQYWRMKAGGGYGQSGGGWIYAKFAANSEKWVAMQLGYGGTPYLGIIGGNQQIVNWRDMLTIQTQSIEYNGDQSDGSSIRHGNTTGDFWVRPPSGVVGAYERWDGVWVPVFIPQRVVLSHDSASVKANDTLRIHAMVVDSTGKPKIAQPAISWSVSGGQSIAPSAASCLFQAGSAEGGPYLLVASASGMRSDTTRIVISRERGMPLDRTKWTCNAFGGIDVDVQSTIDGLNGTCWNTRMQQRAGQWFGVDMQAQHSVCRAVIRGEDNSDYPRAYQAYVSVDGVSWGTAVASGASTSGLTDIHFSPQTCRFFKVVISADGPQNAPFWSICEVSLYTTDLGDIPQRKPVILTGLAKQAHITQTPKEMLVVVRAPASHRFTVCSAVGKMVYHGEGSGITVHRVSLVGWPAGVYFVRMQSGRESFTRSITIGR